MARLKSIYVCQSCGATSNKWLGRCPDCGSWNGFVEEREAVSVGSDVAHGHAWMFSGGRPRPYQQVSTDAALRLSSGMDELDRVLGGGLVAGSVVLLGGDPGIGKSTLLLQVASCLAEGPRPVIYISGEESERQVKLRGERLGVRASGLLLYTETNLDRILEELKGHDPALVVLDSVQTVYSPRFSSAPGSISQIREVAAELLYFAKSSGTPVFLIGHVTKEGNLAGPKALEHIVDTVLYFEGERYHAHRMVRATKNRYGAAGELGVFEMTGRGLVPVVNPSGLFLSERPEQAPGSVVVCCLEGTRPLLLEIQALVSRTGFGYPRRVVLGVDSNRVALLLAVLEKRLGLPLAGEDVFVNVVGGLSVGEPAADLGVAAAVASSFKGCPVDARTVLLGEVGLAGEVRAAQQVPSRAREAARLGFQRIVLPASNLPLPEKPESVELVGVRTMEEALDLLF